MNNFPTYPKINSCFKRDRETNRFIVGQWSLPEYGLLADIDWHWTEKVDGCVGPKTCIRMADGSRKSIQKIKEGDYVMAQDDNGRVLATPVLGVRHQSPAGRWLRLKVTREELGSGPAYGLLSCTHDHRVWTPDRGYVEANRLKVGDSVMAVRSDLALTPLQFSVLFGKLLGDGSLTYHDDSNTASVEWGHVESDAEYLDWVDRGLGSLAGNRGRRISGYGSEMVVGRSQQGWGVYDAFRTLIDPTGKQVSELAASWLDPISIAFWYMDDGSLLHTEGQEDRARIATNGFSEESVGHLVSSLCCFGIDSFCKDVGKGPEIWFNSEGSERLFLLVAPYIPPVMQRKLPERYRGHPGWLPAAGHGEFRTRTFPQRVLSIEDAPTQPRWDIETATHNFFTTAMLVHNTNVRIQLQGVNDVVRASFRGRTDKADLPLRLVEHLDGVFKTEEAQEKYAKTLDLTDGKVVIFYGEGYGGRIQKGGNYRPDESFILFDVRVQYPNGHFTWLSKFDVSQLAAEMGVPVVPSYGTATLYQAIAIVQDGFDSQLGCPAPEGIVGTPAIDLYDANHNRLIVKIKSVDFK